MDGEFYQALIENLFDGVYAVNTEGEITYWNKAAERIAGFCKAEVIGRQCSSNLLRHIDEDGNELCVIGCPLAAAITEGKMMEANVYLHHKDGYRVPISVRVNPIRNENNEIVGAVELFSENSKNRNIIQELEKLKNEVFTDPVTNIGNRKLAQLKMEHRMQDLITYQIPFGVLFIDIDHFKQFNDNYSHEVGDKVLAMVAKTIANMLRGMDIIARWGGEEFIIILGNVDGEALKIVAERIRVFVEKTWLTINGKNLRVTVSIGGALAKVGEPLEELVNRADYLMYESKKAGRNRVTINS